MTEISTDTKIFIEENLHANVRTLALKKLSNKNIQLKIALEQISAYQIILKKAPTWSKNRALIYPPHISLEQCSSELTARYKAAMINDILRCAGIENLQNHLDLTGGLGIDCYFISQGFTQSEYVDYNDNLCELAKKNYTSLSAHNIKVRHSSSEEYLQTTDTAKYDLIYIDPARRDNGGAKVFSISECTPNVCELSGLIFSKTDHLVIKLSPMLDITLAIREMGGVRNVLVVSVNNECKEVIIHCQRNYDGEINLSCANIINALRIEEFSCKWEDEKSIDFIMANSLKKYLYEPNASLLKAGIFKTISKEWGIAKLHTHTHLYTSDTLLPDFHGRIFEVKNDYNYTKRSPKEIQAICPQANVLTRNFPMSANSLQDKLRLKDGGDNYVIGTTYWDSTKHIIVAARLK